MIQIRKKSPSSWIEMRFKTEFGEKAFVIARKNGNGDYVINNASGDYVATYKHHAIKENLDNGSWMKIT